MLRYVINFSEGIRVGERYRRFVDMYVMGWIFDLFFKDGIYGKGMERGIRDKGGITNR